jgi:acylphosphatase
MRVGRRFIINGRVQGVGFRYFTRDVAVREGVTGWVTNRLDGCVEAYVEGESQAVTRMERALRQGPPGARVESVQVHTEDASGAYTRFDVT